MHAQLEMRLLAPRPRPARARVFFDTTTLPAAELKAAIARAELQDEKVLAVYRAHHALSPSACLAHLEAAGVRILITSVRRSISTLTDAGALYRSPLRERGPWGAPESVWALVKPQGNAA